MGESTMNTFKAGIERAQALAENWRNGNITDVIAAFAAMHPLDAARVALHVAAYLPETGSLERILGQHAPREYTPASPPMWGAARTGRHDEAREGPDECAECGARFTA